MQLISGTVGVATAKMPKRDWKYAKHGGVPELGVGWQSRNVKIIEVPDGMKKPEVQLRDFEPLTKWEFNYIKSGEKGKTIFQRIWDKFEFERHEKQFNIPRHNLKRPNPCSSATTIFCWWSGCHPGHFYSGNRHLDVFV